MKNRLLSLFMACCMLFSSMVFSPSAVAADTLVQKDHTGMYGAHLLSRTEITKKGDGSFDVTVDLYTYYAVLKQNTNLTSSTDDFYVVDRDGRYLVELWGGDGASVGAAKGGLGGYVYGVMDLKVGDVLYYTLGGAGTVSAEPGKGGGANGGGGAGDRGSTAVGGGGGYSALFFYENGSEAERFYDTYTDQNGLLTGSVSEADRVSKYIMIAGGGGGAGTGSTTSASVSHASGGDGGHFGTTSGTLDAAEGYAVSGSFFSGVGGGSTDGSGEYAGQGGTYLPGKVITTAWSLGKGGQPNDWVGAQNKNLIGGAGGTGNYRGGGGGAGFAGGSGGVVSNVVLATGVGGGGGGSSFVFRDDRLAMELQTDAMDYSIGRERPDQRAGDEDGALGGFFHIVYLDEDDVSYLSDLNIEFARTPFFNITAFEAINTVNGVPREPYEFIEVDTPEERADKINIDHVSYSIADNSYAPIDENTPAGALATPKFKIPKVSLMPNRTTGEDRDHLTIRLTFTPKADFAGGNNVPLFAGSVITAIPSDGNALHAAGEIPMKNFCGYVNVPLKLSPAPVNHTPQGLDPEKMTHKVSSLYVDRYADVRGNYDAHWQYCFLEEIGMHSVTDELGNPVPVLKDDGTDNTVSPDETTRFFVELSATAKTPTKSFAKLGDPVTSATFTGVSVITIAGSGMETLGQNMVVYNKSLSYLDGQYVLGLHVSSDSSGSIQSEGSMPKFNNVQYGGGIDQNGQTVSRISTVSIPIDGVYTVTLKGGNGGMGGSASFTLLGANGGTGGVGANLSATFYLPVGTRLMFYAGKNAADQTLTNKGALGGDPSYVAVLDENGDIDYYLMIAAGGPGGGGAGALWSDGTNGTQPTAIEASTKKLTTEAALATYTGATGNDGGWGGSGKAGTAGTSYIYAAEKDADGIELRESASLGNPGTLQAGGGASLTCDSLGEALGGSEAQLGRYVLDTAISKYFTVKDVKLDVTSGDKSSASVTYDTQTYIDKDTKTDGEDYVYSLVTANVSLSPVLLNAESEYKHVEFTVNIHLTPRAKFLGGNDVKVIEPARDTTGLLTGMQLSLPGTEDYIGIGESRTLDYANVAIDPSLQIREDDLTVQNKTYVYGDSLYMYDLVESVTLPDLSGYTWEADYLKLIDPREDATPIHVSQTTPFDIYAGAGPLYEDPYATTVGAVDALTDTGTAMVYTDFAATFDLTHIELGGVTLEDGRDLIPFGSDGAGGYIATNDYVFTLKTEATGGDHHEHHLPKSITVTVGDTVLREGEGYTYDRGYDTDANHENHATEAKVTIYQEYITGNVHITAAACEEHHTLYYVYQSAPGSEATATLQLTSKHYSEYIDPQTDFAASGTALPAPDEHYKFVWDFGELDTHVDEEDGKTYHIMPKGEAWVTGSYVPKDYTVTVHYVLEDGTKAAESHSETFAYGSDYSIVSPAVSGFVPDMPTVTGTVNGDMEITVTFAKAEGVTIYYLYADGTTAADTVELSFGKIESGVTVPSPNIVGYTPDKPALSVTAADDAKTFTVTYAPNRYTLTFTVDGEVVETRTVEYDSIYSYDPTSGSYVSFPTAVKLGFTFEGWKRGAITVRAGDTVKITADTTLEASFKSLSFLITVHYVNDLGDTVHPSASASFDVGNSYFFDSPTVAGHEDADDISGIMPAQNLVFTVTYTRSSYTVTVHYETPSGAQKLESYRASVLHGDSYSVTSPSLNGYRPNLAVVEGVVNAAHVEITVTYYSTAISVDISWGDMLFSYDLGNWDPQTHTYSGGSLTPLDGSNTVSVTNNTSGTRIAVGFKFIVSNEYPGITGYYSSDAAGSKAITGEVTLGTSQDQKRTTAYFHLEDNESLGALALPNSFTAGNCTLTIREAN